VSTPGAAIACGDLLAYTDFLAQRWLNYFQQNPAALDVDIGGKTGTLRELETHIFQAEQFFADRLLGKASPPPQKLESISMDELRRLHGEAHEQLESYIATAGEEALQRKQTFGPTTVSNRKLLAQAVLHSVHHWAQVAMEVRQAGFPTHKPQDIIISPVME
jgi:uncharacterized damage-inducible protein DinB